MALLQVDNLTVEFAIPGGSVKALDNFSLRVDAGSYHGIIGESGSGKSIAMLAIMGLLPKTATITADQLALKGRSILDMSTTERRNTLYQDVSIIFQEPHNSLNPSFKIKSQINETLEAHGYNNRKKRTQRTRELLSDVGLVHIDNILDSYPHQLTAGILQRIMIAIALACEPDLLIADEPTASLDTFEQGQITEQLTTLVRERNMAMVLIAHDLHLMREQTDYVTIMYCGQIVESGSKDIIFEHAKHPYTHSILASEPSTWNIPFKSHVPSLKGATPSLQHLPVGCYLGPRCPYAEAHCVQAPEPIYENEHMTRCHFAGSIKYDR
ncbi:MAG: ABC transporter ATP-binding protein [Gammaproteobacteria bacterium]|nr:ABC transporter ATP-binding protein [Gammaproteobacteria bacterium]NNJ72322.1 ABC transporter ATP-binding protein [Enterobacterales bacterium]